MGIPFVTTTRPKSSLIHNLKPVPLVLTGNSSIYVFPIESANRSVNREGHSDVTGLRPNDGQSRRMSRPTVR